MVRCAQAKFTDRRRGAVAASGQGSAELGEQLWDAVAPVGRVGVPDDRGQLVDRDGRIAPLDTVFFDSLLDENAASHIALGSAYETVENEDINRINRSEIHIDFMIGGDGVSVTGTTAAGEEIAILTDGRWAFA